MSIFIATCKGCGAKILVWCGSPDALCYRCQQREEKQLGLGKHQGLGRWTGGGLL